MVRSSRECRGKHGSSWSKAGQSLTDVKQDKDNSDSQYVQRRMKTSMTQIQSGTKAKHDSQFKAGQRQNVIPTDLRQDEGSKGFKHPQPVGLSLAPTKLNDYSNRYLLMYIIKKGEAVTSLISIVPLSIWPYTSGSDRWNNFSLLLLTSSDASPLQTTQLTVHPTTLSQISPIFLGLLHYNYSSLLFLVLTPTWILPCSYDAP